MNKFSAAEAIRQVALRNGVSAAEVRKEMELAIAAGMASSDPVARVHWAEIPRQGEKPSPEEVLAHMAEWGKHRV